MECMDGCAPDGRQVAKRSMALILCLLLVSCGAARSAAPAPSSLVELSRHVLVIEERSGGRVVHSWRGLSDVELTGYWGRASRRSSVVGRIQLVGDDVDECREVYERCLRQCMADPVPPDFDHYVIQYGVYGHKRYCDEKCMELQADCFRRRNGKRAYEFSAVDEAVDWLKRNREAIVLGTVVVIAGVAFVAVVAGSGGGALVLAPVLLVVSRDVLVEPLIAEMSP
jgi:hypothetical protein